MMGRIIGVAAVAGLHTDPDFRAALEASNGELKAARAKGLAP